MVVRSTTGLYIRFNGHMSPGSKLTVVYAAFGFFNCYSSNYFQCRNRRCIMMSLVCDGFDHCSDGSDEAEFCFDSSPIGNRLSTAFGPSWWDKYPNFNFRPVLATPTVPDIPLLACSLALIIIVLTMIMVMCWLCLKGKNPASPIHNGIASARGTLGFFISSPEEAYLDSPPDSPPLYEAPPSYEEVMKIMKALASEPSDTEPGASSNEVDRQKNESPSTSQSRLRRLFLTPFTSELWQLAASGIESLPRAVSSKFSPRKFSDPFPTGLFTFDRNTNNENKEGTTVAENTTATCRANSPSEELNCLGATAKTEMTILNPRELDRDRESPSENPLHVAYQTWPLSLEDKKKKNKKISCKRQREANVENLQPNVTLIADVSPTRSMVLDRDLVLAWPKEELKEFCIKSDDEVMQAFQITNVLEERPRTSAEVLIPFEKKEVLSPTSGSASHVGISNEPESNQRIHCNCRMMNPGTSSSCCVCSSFPESSASFAQSLQYSPIKILTGECSAQLNTAEKPDTIFEKI